MPEETTTTTPPANPANPTPLTSGAPQDPSAPTGSPPADPAKPAAAPAAPAEPVKPAEPAKPAEPVKPAAAPNGEVKYDLKLPEKSALDPAVVERTAATARALGLSPDAAQKALNLVHQEVASHVDALTKAHQPGGAEWTKQVDAWESEIKADPKLGATVDERLAAVQKGRTVIARYTELHPTDAPAFKEFLEVSKLGSHPAMARFFAYLGKAAGEGQFVQGGPPASAPKSVADVFWPDGGNREKVTEGQPA